MEWKITAEERRHLRELAARQAEIASLPVMEKRRSLWYGINDGRPGAIPGIIVDTATFRREFLPEGVFCCETPAAREIESQLLKNVRNHELIDDDKVIPDVFDINWVVEIDEFGFEVEIEPAVNREGRIAGRRFVHPIKDIERDVGILKPAVCSVDREKTMAWKEFCEDVMGDLLEVKISSGVFGGANLTYRMVKLMGMEAFFTAMFDCPEQVHRLMGFLRDNALRVMRWAESEGLLRVNNRNGTTSASSPNFTTRLPAREIGNGPVKLCDMWGAADSQETVGVSPRMFAEFCYPYYRDVCEPLGLLYYGCCEPVHGLWEIIKNLPRLTKIAISPWCDEDFMGEALKGLDIVYSRRPDPALLGVSPRLDEEMWKNSIKKTLEAARGLKVEFLIRDVYTVHNDIQKVNRAVKLARQTVEETL